LANEFGLSYGAVRTRLKTLKSKGISTPTFDYKKDRPTKPLPKPEKTFDELYEEFNKLIGKTVDRPPTPKTKKGTQKRKVVIADPHNPFIDKEKFAHFIACEKGKADECIVAGDIDDNYALSRFVKTKQVPAVDSLTQVDWFLHILSESFSEVNLIGGNHDKMRILKYFQSHNIPIEIIEQYVKLNYMEVIAKRYDNVKMTGTKVDLPNIGELFHFCLVGKDCVVGHWESYSKVNLRASENCFLWYHQWQSTLKLPDIRLLLQGHTHQLGSRAVWGDKMYGETGCLCQVQEYTIDGRVGYTPPQRGYWAIIQNDGITDFKQTRFYPL